MKHVWCIVIILCCTVALSVVAQSEGTKATEQPQTTEVSAETNQEEESQSDSAETEVTLTPKAPSMAKAPRQYPIAPGVWYPGDPVPTKPSRYYRVRCWPGCHSYGEWIGPVDPDHASSGSY